MSRKSVVVICVIYLFVQATLAFSLNGDPIDDAKAQIEKNKKQIDEMYDDSTALFAEVNERYEKTHGLLTVADDKVDKFLKIYEKQVEDIDKDFHEKYGNFTKQDEICILIKNNSLTNTRKAARNDIARIVNNETDFEVNLLAEVLSKLRLPIQSLGYTNKEIISNCTDPSEKVDEKCLTKELVEVKQDIEDLTKLSDRIKEDLKKHSNADELLAKEIDYIVKTTDDDFKKVVDKYSTCLANHHPSTTTSNPSNMGKATVGPKGPENNNGTIPGNQGTFVIQPN